MQRHEIVSEAIRVGIPVNVTAGDIVKYWTIKEQEHAIAKTELQIGLVETAVKSLKTLLEHKYPIIFDIRDYSDVDVQIETPKKYQMNITVKLSSKIITMINNFWSKDYYLTPREDIVSYLHGVIDVLKIKLAAEKKHLAFLNEEI